MSFPPRRMPLVLRLSECDYVDRAGKEFLCAVAKLDMHLMRIIVVLVDEHQGPLTVWTMELLSDLKFESPPYTALIVWLPAVSVAVLTCAESPASEKLPSELAPS